MFEHLQYLQSFETVGLIFVSPINQHPKRRPAKKRDKAYLLFLPGFLKLHQRLLGRQVVVNPANCDITKTKKLAVAGFFEG